MTYDDADVSPAPGTAPVAIVPFADTSDADLVGRSRAGEDAAFGELWRRHYRSGLTVARSITSSIDADDLVQEAYSRILLSIRRGEGPTGSFRAYLFTSIRNTAAAWGRSRRETTVEELDTIAEASSAEQDATDALERSLTHRAFRSLPTRWQEVLWYTEIEQMKPAEIAPLLGMNAVAVAQLAFRAREGLREAWIQAHLQTVADDSDCQWTIERLGAYSRNNLGKRDLGKVERHLLECSRCPIVASEAKEVSGRLVLVLLPLTIGVGGSAAYLAWVQGGAGAISALAATPSSLVPGAVDASGAGASTAGNGAGSASAGTAGSSGAASTAGGGILAGVGGTIGLAAASALVAASVAAAVIVPAVTSAAPETTSVAAEQPVSPRIDDAPAAAPRPGDLPSLAPSIVVPHASGSGGSSAAASAADLAAKAAPATAPLPSPSAASAPSPAVPTTAPATGDQPGAPAAVAPAAPTTTAATTPDPPVAPTTTAATTSNPPVAPAAPATTPVEPATPAVEPAAPAIALAVGTSDVAFADGLLTLSVRVSGAPGSTVEVRSLGRVVASTVLGADGSGTVVLRASIIDVLRDPFLRFGVSGSASQIVHRLSELVAARTAQPQAVAAGTAQPQAEASAVVD